MNINWKVRIANKQFWFSLVPAILLVIQAGAAIFGYTVNFGELGNSLLAFAGYSDSKRARHYEKPWKE